MLEIYFHPQYDPKTLKHNIAIMRLKIKINFRRSHGRIKKIEVDRNHWSLPNTCTITVVGWGAKEVRHYPLFYLLNAEIIIILIIDFLNRVATLSTMYLETSCLLQNWTCTY